MRKADSGGMKINQAVRTDIANSVLCWLATVDSEGIPNVTPKEIFTSYSDDRIIIADIGIIQQRPKHSCSVSGLRELC
ncbi:pyridoxamine 5'-phosphate oxidase family protein [Chelativorans sp. YIM 93263]|uniref:pyridoxamine 5'-phosphate oxidase family protein n=1 Tax=Chelativorans sp. YIM 93263 TaxID=2906648 RepID=UPI0023784043|nr:pyridoxamine 5'-phosphate oxidase family protein [Chelativorans sp. YIM 93263]